jgi:excisionase family DNA binding protein
MSNGAERLTEEPEDTAVRRSLLTVEQAANRMGISARSLRRLVQFKRIRHLRIGRMVRLHPHDVDAYLQTSTVEAVAA